MEKKMYITTHLKVDIVLQTPSRIIIIIIFCRKLVISPCIYISVVCFFK